MGGLHHWGSKIPQGTGFPNDLHLVFSRGGPRASNITLPGHLGPSLEPSALHPHWGRLTSQVLTSPGCIRCVLGLRPAGPQPSLQSKDRTEAVTLCILLHPHLSSGPPALGRPGRQHTCGRP